MPLPIHVARYRKMCALARTSAYGCMLCKSFTSRSIVDAQPSPHTDRQPSSTHQNDQAPTNHTLKQVPQIPHQAHLTRLRPSPQAGRIFISPRAHRTTHTIHLQAVHSTLGELRSARRGCAGAAPQTEFSCCSLKNLSSLSPPPPVRASPRVKRTPSKVGSSSVEGGRDEHVGDEVLLLGSEALAMARPIVLMGALEVRKGLNAITPHIRTHHRSEMWRALRGRWEGAETRGRCEGHVGC